MTAEPTRALRPHNSKLIVLPTTVIKECGVARSGHLRWTSASVASSRRDVLLAGSARTMPRRPQRARRAASSDTTSSTPATSEAPADSPLEGSWRAGPVSLEETEATVRRHGLGRWVEDYRQNAPFFGDSVLTLTIRTGPGTSYGNARGGQPEPIDYNAEYEIRGDTVVFHHSDGSNTYRWEVHDDSLRLHFVKSTLPGYRGITAKCSRALYMTEAFTRRADSGPSVSGSW